MFIEIANKIFRAKTRDENFAKARIVAYARRLSKNFTEEEIQRIVETSEGNVTVFENLLLSALRQAPDGSQAAE